MHVLSSDCVACGKESYYVTSQDIAIAADADWDVVMRFADGSDAVVADISALVIHLSSADTSSEVQTGRPPPLAVATEVCLACTSAAEPLQYLKLSPCAGLFNQHTYI